MPDCRHSSLICMFVLSKNKTLNYSYTKCAMLDRYYAISCLQVVRASLFKTSSCAILCAAAWTILIHWPRLAQHHKFSWKPLSSAVITPLNEPYRFNSILHKGCTSRFGVAELWLTPTVRNWQPPAHHLSKIATINVRDAYTEISSGQQHCLEISWTQASQLLKIKFFLDSAPYGWYLPVMVNQWFRMNFIANKLDEMFHLVTG